MPWNTTDPAEMSLVRLLTNVCRLAALRGRAYVEKTGISSTQGQVLIILHGRRNVPQSKIAKEMNASPAAVTSVLQRMERDGWITRTRDHKDQRMVRISPSRKAEKLQEEVKRAFKLIEKEICSLYSEAERDILRNLLLRLNDNMAMCNDEFSDNRDFADEQITKLGGQDEKSN